MRLRNRFKQEKNNIALLLKSSVAPIEPVVCNDVPYVSQFAHPEYAEKILKDGVQASADPSWQNTGAESPEEYAQWSTTMCGMACTAMALSYFTNENHPIVTLAKDALEHHVYRKYNDELSAMFYKEFTGWIHSYGLNAEIYSRLTLSGIRYILNTGGLVIASVNPNIRGYVTADLDHVGGHLVLVTGYNTKEKTFTIHNPSGFVSLDSQENHTLSEDYFLKYYAGRGLALGNTSPED